MIVRIVENTELRRNGPVPRVSACRSCAIMIVIKKNLLITVIDVGYTPKI